ncbi:hypothetical protein RQP46_010011 [Phenoliferia psychrophenolica]
MKTVSALVLGLAIGARATTDLVLSSTGSYPSSSTLYGIMYEDISHSGDGGLYAELLQNRAFQQVTPGTTAALSAWSSVGKAAIAVVNSTKPVSSALPNCLELTYPRAAKSVGVKNSGYWGISIRPSWTYKASFYAKSVAALASPLSVSLVNIDGTVLASAVAVPSGVLTSTWIQYSVELTPTIKPASSNNTFQVTFDAPATGGQPIHFALFSLFPPTANGMRIDIAEALKAMNPSFFRLPGGNNLESFDTRWKFNETIGPLVDRPGRVGDWSYVNTDGLGLMEYLDLCEDFEVEPYMAVYSGYSLNGESVPADDFQWVWEAAIAQIQFAIGDAATNGYAALRAKYGHPEPYKITKIEIGNEDQFGLETYEAYRYSYLVGNLTKVFPHLEYMASNAAYITGIERNSDLVRHFYVVPENAWLTQPIQVFSAAYAPVLNNINDSQWTPNLISFDASGVILSTSYYVQQMFSVNRGDTILPMTPVRAPPVYYVASKDSTTGTVFFKASNTGAKSEMVSIAFEGVKVGTTGTATTLTSNDINASNTPEDPYNVVPVVTKFTVTKNFKYTLPAYSFVVLKFTPSS